MDVKIRLGWFGQGAVGTRLLKWQQKVLQGDKSLIKIYGREGAQIESDAGETKAWSSDCPMGYITYDYLL